MLFVRRISAIGEGLFVVVKWYFAVLTSGSNSVVECQLPKLDVAGSNPVSRSIFSTT